MKNLTWWGWVGAVGIALAGCGSSGDSGSSASVRIANATLTHPSLDLLVNSASSVTGVATDTVSAYVGPSSGSVSLQVNDSGNSTALANTVPTLTAGAHYTLLAYESNNTVKTVMLTEDVTAPAAGSAQLRIYNAAPDAGKLDVYITDPSVSLANAGSPISFTTGTVPIAVGPLTYSPGTYRVRVTGYGNKNDLRLDMPAVTIASQQVGTVVLTPASGGVLLNGSAVLQQSTYSATRNTNTRVRLAAAVSGGASVSVTAGSSVIDAGSVAPSFGFYTLVPANSALNINVANQSVGAPATALAAGSDMTLLVYGAPGNATASLLLDDNRPPADTTQVKMRMINGVTSSTGLLTLTANAVLVGTSGIAPGTASSYTTVPGSTSAMNLNVTSSTASGNYLTDATNTLNAGSVYTVMVGGDANTTRQLLIR